MTNEELAVMAKAGDRSALAALWEQNTGLLATLFRRLYIRAGARVAQAGVTWEDVEQCFFLAVVNAVRTYEPERGMLFSTFLVYAVKTVFFELIGYRTERARRDPLARSCSLDDPITGEDGSATPRGELTPDHAAEQAFEDAERRVCNEQLHNTLEQCLDTLNERAAAVIRARYYDGQTSAQAGERLGLSAQQVRALEQTGMHKLRTGMNRSRLERFRDELIETRAYHGTGFSAWKHGGSVQERTAIYLEDKGL